MDPDLPSADSFQPTVVCLTSSDVLLFSIQDIFFQSANPVKRFHLAASDQEVKSNSRRRHVFILSMYRPWFQIPQDVCTWAEPANIYGTTGRPKKHAKKKAFRPISSAPGAWNWRNAALRRYLLTNLPSNRQTGPEKPGNWPDVPRETAARPSPDRSTPARHPVPSR